MPMSVRHRCAEPARRTLRPMAMWSTMPVRLLLLVLAVTPVLTACDASGDSADVSPTRPAVTSPAKHDQPCRVTLTQHNSIQVAELHGPPHELSFAGRGPIAVDITGDCPRSLRVAPAVTPGRNINLGESTDQIPGDLSLSRRDTDLALIYQPCAETGGSACRGPSDIKLFPLRSRGIADANQRSAH